MDEVKAKPIEEQINDSDDVKELILFNDEVNTFEHVIQCLVEVCRHTTEQAEQCALIAHFKGKCPVKSGSFTELKPMADELTRRYLTVEIQ
ncbi:MAG: ATP-dependent Clp protease adaptor ClpS [Bacteroidales bacterium]